MIVSFAGDFVVAATAVVFALAVAALALPLLRRAERPNPPAPFPAREGGAQPTLASTPPSLVGKGAGGVRCELLEEREAALGALRELDFDYAVGKLAERDYQILRARYEQRALALLKAVDELGTADGRGASGPLAGLHDDGPAPEPTLSPDPVARREQTTSAAAAARRNGAGPLVAARAERRAPAGPPLVPPKVGGRDAGYYKRHGGEPSAAGAGGGRVALAATAVAVVFVAGVAGLYVVGSRSQSDQRPVATLDGIGPRALAIAPADPARAFLASAAGLWTSADGGASWQVVPALASPLRALAVSAARPERLYAAGPGLLARSDDDGRSWATLPFELPGGGETPRDSAADLRALGVDPADPDRLWVAVDGAGLFRSDDAGHSWTRTSAEAPPNTTGLAVVGGESPLLYLASATEGVLASADEGRGWAPASGVLSGALPTRRVSSLVFDPTSGDTATTPDGRTLRGALYAGTDQGIFKSVDRGQTWARLPLAASVAAVAGGGSDSRLLLAVDREGRVYRSHSRGVTWDGS